VHAAPPRWAADQIELAGVTIVAGETVFLALFAADHDPGRFDHPDEFDPARPTNPQDTRRSGRFATNTPSRNRLSWTPLSLPAAYGNAYRALDLQSQEWAHTRWNSLTFSGPARSSRMLNVGNTGSTRENTAAALLLSKRTNDLVKAILKIVELRGLEPLTFSLRTRRATDCAIAPRTGWADQHRDFTTVKLMRTWARPRRRLLPMMPKPRPGRPR
jgi:Cytochrome P450